MKVKTLVLTPLAYPVVTFATAVLWHLVAFKEPYDRIEYFENEEPIA